MIACRDLMVNPEIYRLGERLGNRLEDNFERDLKEKAGSFCIALICYGQTQVMSCSEYRKEPSGSIKCEYFLISKGILTSSKRLFCVELVFRFEYCPVLFFLQGHTSECVLILYL
jgi:hypothetical protein